MTVSSDSRTSGQVEAFLEGQRIRKQRGETQARDLAKSLFRNGREDTLSVQAEVGGFKAKFPETWQFLAAGLAPEIVSPDGKLLKL